MFINPILNGSQVHYFCGHSLGLQPINTRQFLLDELDKWGLQAVEGHFTDPNPWFHYHKLLKPGLVHLCGAKESEVAACGSLTSNLHNLFASFYKPTNQRFKILAESTGFSSDTFALKTQVKSRGYDPDSAIVFLQHDSRYCFSTEYIISEIEKNKETLALIWLSGVNFLSGQAFDIASISAAAQKYNITIGLDLAHAIGNIPLSLHDNNIDFAVWCSYKYLNAGPGATGGYFVHEKNFIAQHPTMPILGGWWGNREETRFATGTNFDPLPDADAWQHSNANVLSLAALRASLDLFLSKGIQELFYTSQNRTETAFRMLEKLDKIEILTPEKERGNMVSIRIKNGDKTVLERLKSSNFLADWREPGIMRFSFSPLYNNKEEWTQFLGHLQEIL